MSAFNIFLCVYITTAVVVFMFLSIVIFKALNFVKQKIASTYNFSLSTAKKYLEENGFSASYVFLSSLVISLIPLVNFASLFNLIVTGGIDLENTLKESVFNIVNKYIEEERGGSNGA